MAMTLIEKTILIFVFFATFSYLQSILVEFIVRCFHEMILEAKDDFEKEIEKKRLNKKIFEQDLELLKIFPKVRKKLYFLTRTIGRVENILFTLLTVVLFHFSDNNALENIEKLIVFALAWLGLKIVGNYKAWEGILMGRFFFYTFLIGSVANLILSISAGVIIFILTFNQF